MQRRKTSGRRGRKIRYAVVGLGYIAQVAVLPGFATARKNSELVALVSDDAVKLKKLGKRYGVSGLYSYEQYDDLLNSEEIDAVYIALPNTMHADYTIKAARAGIHVLCEKPMEVTESKCKRMTEACRKAKVKLMIAYRLHLEHANLRAVQIAASRKLGELRIFNSVFTMEVTDKDNIRLDASLGGGPLYDIGIYCLNASRYIFQDEPVEVVAFSSSAPGDKRFKEVDEMTSVILRYPGNRLATFTCSFGSAPTGHYQVIGTKGDLRVDQAYEYADERSYTLTINEKSTEHEVKKHDQFGAELIYFSDCILKNREPEPNGIEGTADVRIIEALLKSARTGRPVKLEKTPKRRYPSMRQKVSRPGISKPSLVRAAPPHD